MDNETIQRVKGDDNQTSISLKLNSLLSDQLGTNQSNGLHRMLTEKTLSLTLLLENRIDLNLKDIISFYDQIDQNLFDHELKTPMNLGEFNKFDDISLLENQRIVLNYNRNSIVLTGYIPKTETLAVSKHLTIYSEEKFIQMLDEYKIHQKINKLFPFESLELIVPVQLQKRSTQFEITAIMERAQFNLFEYSRNHQINEDEALNIFVQILDQIINLHSVNVAHRDIKPQNIFYVKNKGWLLSDFGESLEYDELEGLYNIRGTIYFLLPSLQESINKNSKIIQNLLQNDLYALVITMIMIKDHQYITDMHTQILNLKDDLLKQVLIVDNLESLKQFRAKYNFQKDKDLIDLTKSCQKQLNADEQCLNQFCNVVSQSQFLQLLIEENAEQSMKQKVVKLLKSNNHKITFFKSTWLLVPSEVSQFEFYLKVDKPFVIQNKMIKNIPNNKNLQESCISTLFIHGYTERTINFANQFLKQTYSQWMHLILIESYLRVNMRKEGVEQLRQFTEGLVFDQLDTRSQIKYLLYLEYFQLNDNQFKQNITFDFRPKSELLERGFHQAGLQYTEELIQQIELLSPNYYQNRDKIVKVFMYRLNEMCKTFCINNISFAKKAFTIAKDLPIYILLQILKKIHPQTYGQFDTNKKLTFLQEIAEILLLQNQKIEFMQNLKLIKESLFSSESWQQAISFQIAQLSTVIMEYIFYNDKINIKIIMDKFVTLLKKIKTIKFKWYHEFILGTLLILLKCIRQYLIFHQNHCLVYVVEYIMNYAYNQNFHICNSENFQLDHIQAQFFLIGIRNFKRSQQLVQKQRKFLSHKATQIYKRKRTNVINFLIKPSIKNLLRIEMIKTIEIYKCASQQFLYNRFFEL